MIAWEESGSGPTIVLVHGNTEDRRGWDAVVPLLEDSYRCVRLDLRGHGESSNADDYSAIAMAEDVATVVAEASIDEPPLLVGHSLGAVVVTAYAAGAPARAVVNVDQGLALGDFAAALQQVEPMLRGEGFHDALGMVFAGLGVDALPPRWREWAEAKHAAARQEVVLGTWQLIFDSDAATLNGIVESMLGAVTVPYLAIHGSDPGDGYAGWLTSHVPTATVEVWDGDGHYPHLVEPERFAARVRAFSGDSES
jgi:pimeloyl-ACP methyl ester carboxylesterase